MTETSFDQPVKRPVSATSAVIGGCGLIAFLVAIAIVKLIRMVDPGADIAYLALFVMFVTALGVFVPDLLWQKVHRRLRGDGSRPVSPSWRRTLTKFAGLLGSFGFVGLIYWLFPEYKGSFYASYYLMLIVIVPPWLLLAIPYIRYVDARMAQPEDGLWQMGRLVTFQWRGLDFPRIRQHMLGWLVKGFFMPLMFTYLCQDLNKFSFTSLGGLHGFKGYYDFFYDLLYFIDVSVCACGYLFAMQLTDTHIRSTEPTMFGWAVALVCYEPFWSLIGRQYLAYDTNHAWGEWLSPSPVLYGFWGVMILGLTLIYVWASLSFGMRFSNLTHRGILTNGPYRWSKHPAYISKNLSWWLISVPFLFNGNVPETLRHMSLLLLLNMIYFLRAKTEEHHLSRDPVYVQYMQWVREHGLFGMLRRSCIRLGAVILPPRGRAARIRYY